ncbi:hypothetical protein ABIA03_000016 [Bradyrhizobium yuanmingense]|uniref:Transposase n=1 Tax=Bradyrhizobium yuanmingense TaxID=108015 RepID=A0ABV4G8B0_9BRAD
MKASKFSDAQKAFILKQGSDGVPVAEICRRAVQRDRTLDHPELEFCASVTLAGWLRRRGCAAKSAVDCRSPHGAHFFLGVRKGQEPVGVEAFGPEAAVEGLDERVIRHDVAGVPCFQTRSSPLA